MLVRLLFVYALTAKVPITMTTTAQPHTTSSPTIVTTWLGLESGFWDVALMVSLVCVALVAAIVVIAAWGSIIAHKREAEKAEIDLASYEMTVDARIAEAHALGVKTGLDSADAKVHAAQANERAANFEKEAEQARLESERIKAVVAWRVLSQRDADALADALSRHP